MTTGSDPWPRPLEMGVSTGKIGANGLGALWMLGAAIGFSINGALVKALLGLGVDVFVVGNTVFSSSDPVKTISQLKEIH